MIDLLKKYIETRIQILKLELITVLANVASTLVSSFIILVFSLFILLMLTFSLAFWLSETLNSNTFGFAIVGGIYCVFFIIYLLYSKKLLERKVKDGIVSSALDSEEKINQEG